MTPTPMHLSIHIEAGGGVYKRFSPFLQKLGISTFEHLLYHVPFRYEDFSLISKIGQVQAGEIVTIKAQVADVKNQYTRRHMTLQKAKLMDETGIMEVTWFNQPFLARVIKSGDVLSVSGTIERFGRKISMNSPEYELVAEGHEVIHTGRLVPVYPETRGITSKWLRKEIYKLLTEYKKEISEYLPDELLQRNMLLPLYDALFTIHFPKLLTDAQKGRERLSFDELFITQLNAHIRKDSWKEKTLGNPFSVDKYEKEIGTFLSSLPFELTEAQKNAVKDIRKDLSSVHPMNRLLQGDVGSGKTVVSAVAMYIAHLNGYQSVLMAPTQILAEQHYQTVQKFLVSLGIKVDLVTGNNSSSYHVASSKQKNNKKIQDSKNLLQNTRPDILIGTHAVLSKKVTFEKLGLVIIDEQQRFGVEQRGIIREKGENPHVLTMTATPIPRTIALTMYGDLDLSYLSELPKGRKIIKTWLVPNVKRENSYDWIRKEILTTDSQVFIICPFIEESESMTTIKAASKEFERLQKSVFPDLRLGLLHGKMKTKEKDEVLQSFREKKYHILVATPVVEVGIDIPNATIIVIEAADRFGLAQLHQLRGRVGRGNKQSYCLLFTDSTSDATAARLKAMEQSNIGAELAELDLKLRGPGDMYGTMQHGLPQLKVASFSDFPLIEKTKKEAEKIFPVLKKYPKLTEKLKKEDTQKISPD